MSEVTKEVEIAKKIRGGYVPEEESDLDKLRRLDKKVKLPAEVAAYTVGIAGSLVLGTGMCIAMGTIGAASLFPLGVVVGVAGMAIVAANYFIYRAVLRRRRRRYAAEVIALSDKMLNN